jgi:hypothetical protein
LGHSAEGKGFARHCKEDFAMVCIFGKLFAAKDRKERMDKNLGRLFFVIFRVILWPIHLWLRLAALCLGVFERLR